MNQGEFEQSLLKDVMFKVIIALLALFVSAQVNAKKVYLEPKQFLKNHFPSEVPKASKLWVRGEVRDSFKKIMERKGPKLIKYWTEGNKTVWILEEIGKAQPITTGYAVENGQITQVRILIYRESHGYGVRHPTYTKQFEGATLLEMTKLDRQIDGISGATLSHYALQKMAKLALYLDSYVKR